VHNVRVDQIDETRRKAKEDPKAAMLDVAISGEWNPDDSEVQFTGPLKFVEGETTLAADFPPFLGGAGRAPTPLGYCFYGAMCCYGSTFATQAAMAGVEIKSLQIQLKLSVDFRTSLGLGEFPPFDRFEFEVDVTTDSDESEVQRVKELADKRCPAMWAMQNPVPFSITAKKK